MAALDSNGIRRLAVARPEPGPSPKGLGLIETKGRHSSTEPELRVTGLETESSKPSVLPVGSALLPRLTSRPFGREERVEVQRRGEELEISCRAGDSPAGAVLDPGEARLPRALAADLVAQGWGNDGFRFSVVPKGADAPRDSGAFESAGSAVTAVVSAKIWEESDDAVQFVVVCPAHAATLTLSSVSIERRPGNGAPVPQSAWIWEATRWVENPDHLVEDAAAHRIGTLFMALPIENGQLLQPDRLARFVRRAGARGISVVAVEGDPAMVLEDGRKVAIARAEAIARYQQGVSAEDRLAGVQYDIEPYLLPSFQSERERVLAAWADTVIALERALGERIDLVLPFWIADRPDARRLLLDRVESHVGRITIMAYRTQSEAVTSAAEPLLAWGSEHNIPVTVGLEVGFVADEIHHYYVPAAQGELHLVEIGDVTAAILLEGAHEGLPGRTFRLDRTIAVPGSRISFLGDVSRMLQVADETERRLSAWSAFSGLAFHGLFER
ncbi:hypothetical protein [Microvirga massiliensis]|uniref:hypothetical protein n=1 Tax=Microvirga massiliensis TaxID=1033741 RepID=UPI00062BBB36|nr:hypothetical protein [Microvirga massiliensis]